MPLFLLLMCGITHEREREERDRADAIWKGFLVSSLF